VPAAARAARYRLLADAARKTGATHVITAHTRDDQAETVLMRMLRGSGIAGLAAMARETERDGVRLARPLLEISKAQLLATLRKAKIAFADDPTNRDNNFTRPRVRALMPALAAEGGDCQEFRAAGVAARPRQCRGGILADGAERYLALNGGGAQSGFEAGAFAALPEEIRVRFAEARDRPKRS